jgi:hypothetical protein
VQRPVAQPLPVHRAWATAARVHPCLLERLLPVVLVVLLLVRRHRNRR